jgi:hypothetical protein
MTLYNTRGIMTGLGIKPLDFKVFAQLEGSGVDGEGYLLQFPFNSSTISGTEGQTPSIFSVVNTPTAATNPNLYAISTRRNAVGEYQNVFVHGITYVWAYNDTSGVVKGKRLYANFVAGEDTGNTPSGGYTPQQNKGFLGEDSLGGKTAGTDYSTKPYAIVLETPSGGVSATTWAGRVLAKVLFNGIDGFKVS